MSNMGNHCGDLALFSGIAEGAEMIITPDHPIPEDEIIANLKAMADAKKKRAIVIVSEKIYPDIHEYQINPGDGAFYGPKLDFKLKDSMGRTWQCGTIQLDVNLPHRFGCYYIDEKGSRVEPVM